MSHSYVSNLPQTADTSSLMDHNAFATPPSRAFANEAVDWSLLVVSRPFHGL